MKHLFKTIFLFVLAALFALPLGACSKSKEDFSDTYNAETDFQYMNFTPNGSPIVASSDEGTYFLAEQYVFFLQKDSKTVIPACSKANCLHNKQSSDAKSLCDAYFVGAKSIFYNDGNLYVVASPKSSSDGKESASATALWKVSISDGNREMLFSLEDHGLIPRSIALHRGMLYYCYYETDAKGMTAAHFYCQELCAGSKAKELWSQDNTQAEKLLCRGKYAYFNIYPADGSTGYQQIIYNLQTGEVNYLISKDPANQVATPIFVNQTLLMTYWQENALGEVLESKGAKCKLDGTVIESVDEAYAINLCDGELMYHWQSRPYDTNLAAFSVENLEGKLLSEADDYPETIPTGICGCDAERIYIGGVTRDQHFQIYTAEKSLLRSGTVTWNLLLDEEDGALQ